MVAVSKLVEQPKDTVHVDSFRPGELAQASVAREKCPLTGLRNGESERIRRRQARILSSCDCRPRQFRWRQDFYAKSQRHQLLPKWAGEFPCVEQIGNGELEGKSKHLLQKLAPLQINENRCIRNEDGHRSSRHLMIQPGVEFAN